MRIVSWLDFEDKGAVVAEYGGFERYAFWLWADFTKERVDSGG